RSRGAAAPLRCGGCAGRRKRGRRRLGGRPMTTIRVLLASLGFGLVLSIGLAPPEYIAAASAAPMVAQADSKPTTDSGGPSFPSIPNPLAGLASMLSPD